MNFKNWLLEERKQELEIDEFVEKLKTKYSSALDKYKKGIVIYRGSSTYNTNDILLINPRTSERKSANTKNYYTLIMSNSPKWSKYPPRDLSSICSIGIKYAKSYGMPLVVLPENNARIGICSDDDLWKSSYNGITLEHFPDDLSNIFRYYLNEEFDSSIENLKQGCKLLDAVAEKDKSVYKYIKSTLDIDYSGNMLKDLYDFLTPEHFEFSLDSISALDEVDNCEVWTDANCLVVDGILLDKILKDENYEL
jgi:hypothetical protein